VSEATPVRGGTPAEARAGWLLLAPALLAILLFFGLPLLAALLLSLTDFDIYAIADLRNLRFVGLGNYARLVRDPVFWQAVRTTLVYVVLGVPLTLGLSLGGALLLDSRLARARGVLRTIYFAPVVTTLVAVAVVWRYLYHPRAGLLNYALGAIGVGPIDWLGDPTYAMPAIALMSIWKGFGFPMLVFLASLQAIPERLYEAARIDGAGRWHQLCWITLPMLRPTFVFVGVMTAIGALQLFAEPYVMTGGGPADSTLSLVLLMYRQGFRWWNLGPATAVAFVLFAIMLAISAVTLRQRGGVDSAAPANAGWRPGALR